VVDLDALATFDPRARLTVRAQSGQADLAGEAHIRGAIPEGDHLVEEGGSPQVRIIDEAGGYVSPKLVERVWIGRTADPRGPFAR